jgi:hypothetical protein
MQELCQLTRRQRSTPLRTRSVSFLPRRGRSARPRLLSARSPGLNDARATPEDPTAQEQGMATRKTAARKAGAKRAAKSARKGATKKAAAKKATKKAAKKAAAKKATKKTAAKKATQKTAKKAAPRKAAKKSAAGSTAATRRSTKKAATPAMKKTAARKATGSKAVAKQATKKPAGEAAQKSTRTTAERRTPGRKAPTAKSSRQTAAITPEQALANTRALLEAKKAHDREPAPWQSLGGGGGQGQAPQSGFQSDDAAHKAEQLHEAESRIPAIQGSVGTHDRHNQAKRDNR